MRFDSGASDLSPFLGLGGPLPKLQTRRFRSQPKQPKHPRSSSRPFDPDDLDTRLRAVVAEREAADAVTAERERKRRVQSVVADCRRRQSQLPDLRESAEVSKGAHVDLPEVARAEARERDLGSRRPSGFEYTARQRMSVAHAPASDDDRDRVSPLLAEPIPPATTASRRSHYPRAAEPSTTDSPLARQTSRRASAWALGDSEPLSPSGQARRSSQRVSWGLGAGLHEPTIFESVPAAWEPLVKKTQGRRPRTMSTGDMLEARGKVRGEEAAADVEGRSSDGELAHYEIANGRRMDWAQADETKMKKPTKSPRKSILGGFRRGSTARASREGEDHSSEGSVGEEREVGDAAQGRTFKSPKFSKARSFWPFRKHSVVDTQ